MRSFRNDAAKSGMTARRLAGGLLLFAMIFSVWTQLRVERAWAAGEAPAPAGQPAGPPLRLGVPQRLTPTQPEPSAVGPVKPAGAVQSPPPRDAGPIVVHPLA